MIRFSTQQISVMGTVYVTGTSVDGKQATLYFVGLFAYSLEMPQGWQ